MCACWQEGYKEARCIFRTIAGLAETENKVFKFVVYALEET